nr:TraX protein [Escherichia coli]
MALLSCASLWYINGNLWALAVVPLVIVAAGVDLRVPRLRWAFYTYYPLHLAALWLIRCIDSLEVRKKPGGHWIIRDLMGLDLVGLASL